MQFLKFIQNCVPLTNISLFIQAHVRPVEQFHRLHSTLHTPSEMDVADANSMEGMKMEMESETIMRNDFSDETHQHLNFSEGPSRRLRTRVRPKLQATKSFPPYSQCIGGLGEDTDQDSVPNSELSFIPQEDTMESAGNEVGQGPERREGFESRAKCAREEAMSRWRMRRRERLGGSCEADPCRWESTRWSGKRRVEETGREGEHDGEQNEGGKNSEWKQCRSTNNSLEKQEEDERTTVGVVEREEKEGSMEANEAGELPVTREGPAPPQWSTPHPILSKLLHSSSSSSSCSSMNLSSAESDEVFSEGEDASSKRRTFRKVRTMACFQFHHLPCHYLHRHHKCGCFGFSGKRRKTIFLNCSLHLCLAVVICMGLKEDCDEVRFEWRLHAWLLLLLQI